ncbi:MAG TPA: hypothetical protein VKQ08_07840 [Cyclobacteriaceae bacterium]|nr:hypothetical protein [Cyclobacteriaceae bacterium]
MKTNKFLIPIATFGLLVLSCSKSSTPAAVSPTAAKQTFSTVNTDVAASVAGLNSAPGNVALNSFATFSSATGSPFGRIKSFNRPGDIKSAINGGLASIRQMILKGSGSGRMEASTPFNFAGKTGIYIYNFGTKGFDKSQTASDIIKIDYPKDNSSTTNDAELQISAYTETSTPSGYSPTLIQAAIYISGTKELELKLTAGYDSNGNANQGSISLFINPYTVSFAFDDSGATSGTESFSFSKGAEVIIGTSFTATFLSAADKASGNPPSALTGYLQLENVRFNMSVDGTKTSSNYNDYVFITVTVDGGVAGHVVWVTDQNNVQQPYVQYNDGSQEALETVFADLNTQLSSLG